MVELIEYEDQYALDFKSINLEWLEKFNLTEAQDLVMLNDPHGVIVQTGGAIFLAKVGGTIVGSAALLHEHDDVYELAKMTVIPSWQGKGVSKLLLERCLEKARDLKAKKIILFSNHQLRTALALYLKYGFRHIAVEASPFRTADVKMELLLNP
jgi:putative acetyltransferase